MKLRRLRREPRVEFCDHCGNVCDDRCRAEAERQRNVDRVRLLGVRL
jgi:hypothetical protein